MIEKFECPPCALGHRCKGSVWYSGEVCKLTMAGGSGAHSSTEGAKHWKYSGGLRFGLVVQVTLEQLLTGQEGWPLLISWPFASDSQWDCLESRQTFCLRNNFSEGLQGADSFTPPLVRVFHTAFFHRPILYDLFPFPRGFSSLVPFYLKLLRPHIFFNVVYSFLHSFIQRENCMLKSDEKQQPLKV